MNLFKRLFNGKGNREPSEPIKPGESFAISKLTLKDGWALATINTKYGYYPNKRFFPWLVLIEVEIIDQNENGHPTGQDAEKLMKVETEVIEFLERQNTVHFIGRVTRNGFRDLIYYIDDPKFNQAAIDSICNKIRSERSINFSIDRDPAWTGASAFLK